MIKRMGLAMVSGSALFLGSLLLFNIQPMAGRLLLPRFGGSAAVWTVCLVAFQVLLLGGYAYAAFLNRFRLSVQVGCHLVLLAAAALWPGFSLLTHPLDAQQTLSPAVRVLLAVAAGVGPAYLLLASGSSLLQAWLARAYPGRNVYRLYAVSNAGSLIGLFAYPFLIEPFLSIPIQQLLWRLLFAVYSLAVAVAAYSMMRRLPEGSKDTTERVPPKFHPVSEGPGGSKNTTERVPPKFHPVSEGHAPSCPSPSSSQFFWILLPLLSTFLLVAATISATYDMTPLPMLWCLLLGSFLLSYIVGFSPLGEAAADKAGVLAVIVFTVYATLRATGVQVLWLTVLVTNGMVLTSGVFLHGWLYRIRPRSERLTGYYLAIAVGGAYGGALGSLAMPLLLNGVYELSGIVLVLTLLIFTRLLLSRRSFSNAGLWIVTMGTVILLLMEPTWIYLSNRNVIWAKRNFYGALKVKDLVPETPTEGLQITIRTLTHGATKHGLQDISLDLRHRPTSYFGPRGGGFPIICAIQTASNRPLRVGVVGLGIGTLAAYGREGDFYRFYEIDPQVVTVARDAGLFAYLFECKANTDIVLGDARLSLAREAAAREAPWDVLVVDAFSGDAVPLHLLTKEAIALFLARTAENGTLVFHISSRYIDFLPLLKANAKSVDAHFWAWHNLTGNSMIDADSRWVLLIRQPWTFPAEPNMAQIPESIIPSFPVLTDEKGSVLPLVDWSQKRIKAYLKAAQEKLRESPL